MTHYDVSLRRIKDKLAAKKARNKQHDQAPVSQMDLSSMKLQVLLPYISL